VSCNWHCTFCIIFWLMILLTNWNDNNVFLCCSWNQKQIENGILNFRQKPH
jgi:hypothetical protein